MLCFHARLFVYALWSPAGKGLASRLSFVMSNCDAVTFPLVSWVRCGASLYQFLIFALFLTLSGIWILSLLIKKPRQDWPPLINLLDPRMFRYRYRS